MATPASAPCTRRRFLVACSAATLVAWLPQPALSLASEQCLLITDDPAASATDTTLLLLRGDRLTRLNQIRNYLLTRRPAIVHPRLDSTDQLLLDLALGDIGAVPRQYGDQLFLDYAHCCAARGPS